MLGLRHLALNVTDVGRSRAFYEELFGMRVVWQPDGQNVYLSSGADNLALHQTPNRSPSPAAGALDHFGFVVASVDDVTAMYRHIAAVGPQHCARIVKEPKQHRDGSYSFYLSDPDGNVIQVLYEPNIAEAAGSSHA